MGESSGGGTTRGYFIEARNVTFRPGARPVVVGGVFVASEWTRIPVARSDDGIPTGLYCKIAEAVTELVSYPTGMGLIAAMAAGQLLGGIGLEFRLVEAKLTYDWKVERKADGPPISFREAENREFPVGR